MDLSREQWLELAVDAGSPHVTLTMTLEHEELTNDKNRVRWKNLVAAAERQLVDLGVDAATRARLMQPAHRVLERNRLGEDGARGLAMLLSDTWQVVHACPHPVRSSARVADRFDLSPLRDHLLPAPPFYVLAIADEGARLLRCDDHEVSPLRLPSAPRSLEDANRFFDEPVPSGPLHRRSGPSAGGGAPSIIKQGFGHEQRSAMLMETWLRGLHGGLLADVGTLDGPLVLACVERVHARWRELFGEDSVFPEPIRGNPERVPDAALRDAALALVSPTHATDEAGLHRSWFQAVKGGRWAVRLDDVVQAAIDQRIDTLLLRRGDPVYGRFVGDGVEELGPDEAGAVDLATQVVALTLVNGGRVYEVDALPSPHQHERFAATLRW